MAGVALCTTTASAAPQDAPLAQELVPFVLDSGQIAPASKVRGTIFRAVIQVPNRACLRLLFDEAVLGAAPADGQPTVVRLTSALDGAVQVLDAQTIQQWHKTSAYFNGDAVLLEVVADSGALPSHLSMTDVYAGTPLAPDEGGVSSLCLGADDRVLAADAAVGRMLPEGCTAWIFDDELHTLLSAGHCYVQATTVIEFNVPLSTATGTPVHPPPEDQYAVDGASVQGESAPLGEDWVYFGCFPNPVTGKTPFERQGAFYELSVSNPRLINPPQQVHVVGFGNVASPVTPMWNQVQKDHTGPYAGVSGNVLRYLVDTTGGNSGSPVVDVASNVALGVHTHGGCDGDPGANRGTGVESVALQYALSHPLGVCHPDPHLDIVYPDGFPDHFHPAGTTMRVQALPGNGGIPLPDTGEISVDVGAGFVTAPMAHLGDNVYLAQIPPSACGSDVHFYVSVQSTAGETVTLPEHGGEYWEAVLSAAISPLNAFYDNFETDRGWTVTNGATLTSGSWERAVPTATGTHVPLGDGDGSGMCYVTSNTQDADVDGGTTTLTSPRMDARAPGAELRYWRHHRNSTTSDSLIAEVSFNDGTTWVQADSCLGFYRLWEYRTVSLHSLAGYVPTALFRVRFTTRDVDVDATVESGIDGVGIYAVHCLIPCGGDLNASGAVDGADLGLLLGNWGGAGVGDITGDGAVGGDDLGQLLGSWGDCDGP